MCKKILFFRSLLVLAVLLLMSAAAWADVSVALSDNLIVIDSRDRSGMIELVNLSADPTEFTLQIQNVEGSEVDGETLIRWAPRRSQVPANRTAPFRVSARPQKDLPPGEYLIRVGVSARLMAPPPVVETKKNQNGEIEQTIAVVVPIVPVLPVTVYYRHQIDTPMIDAQALVATPDDEKYLGYFPVVKRTPQYSFVGTVQVVEQATGKVINQGRLHLKQGTESSRVRMPRGEQALVPGTTYCLNIWDRFPAKGQPVQQVCGAVD
ncbi:MAG: hypothetical protein JXR59_02425 [Desulfuromonadaceae bacterium]|nr:hypothetical protein [Desulfuromonadaceae bacterium]